MVVTTPEVSAIRDADRIIGLLEANEVRDIRLVVNRLRQDMINRGDMMSIDDVVEILAIELIGIMPDDETSLSQPTPASLLHLTIPHSPARLTRICAFASSVMRWSILISVNQQVS